MPASAPSGRNPHRPRAPRSATAQARGRFEIPEGITHIGKEAFEQRRDLQGTLVLCSTLKEVGVNAFCRCKGLTSIEIGEAVEVIGYCAFAYCTGLKGALTFGPALRSIDYCAFQWCKGLTAVNIPRSAQVHKDAFRSCSPTICHSTARSRP